MFCIKCDTQLLEEAVVVQELLSKAQECEENEEYEEAMDYYNRVLEIEHDRDDAREGLDRVKKVVSNFVYYQTSATNGVSFGYLQLKNKMLVYRSKKGNEARYYLDEIYNVRNCVGNLAFTYGGKRMEIRYGCTKIPEWIKIINKAHYGNYPKRKSKKVMQVEAYILEHFNPMHKIEAVNYYIEQMGVTNSEATNAVATIL
ncbi:MAG: hypothetical protein Q4F05_19690 [bacterium]|nr:hypothetical protein [bacterium]